jgi:hypothetical protein
MKFLTLFISIFCLNSALQSETYDWRAEEQIEAIIRSPEFSNSVIEYHFNGSTYPLTIIHNPNHENLMEKSGSDPITIGLVISADMPITLSNYLERKLFFQWGIKEYDAVVDLKGRYSLEFLTGYHPVPIAERIDDPDFDARIKEAFHSSDFTNQVFYYHLDGIYYRIRIIHNPEKAKYFATKNFRLEKNGPVKAFTIRWGFRYGIIVDKPVSQKLIDHLSALAEASNWDWCFSFKVRNGTYVQHEKTSYGFFTDTTTTWDLDTWYEFTDNLQKG